MAAWAAKGVKKDCETCKKLSDPKQFKKGAKVRHVMDCENCEVFLSQPIPENENVVELYNALPLNYDGMSGQRIITTGDIKFIFDLYRVPKDLRYEYYHKIMYLAEQIFLANIEKQKKEDAKTKKTEGWKDDKQPAVKGKTLKNVREIEQK